MKKIKKGFTLIELLVVIAIIAILAAVIAPNAFKAIEKSKVSSAISDYKAIKTASLSYYADTGKWPVTANSNHNASVVFVDGGDVAPFTGNAEPTGWNGPYLEKWPDKNPWGGSYTFTNSTTVANVITEINAKHITINGINAQAISRLETELDGGTADGAEGTVRYVEDANNDPTGNTVYIIISEQ